jgi:hypothetical protein
MLIHQQNAYAPRSKQCISCCEAQSHEQVTKVKKTLCIINNAVKDKMKPPPQPPPLPPLIDTF